jgi:YqaJ-like viral recombinase domain
MAKFLNVAPRSPEWFAARLGIPTSSEFHRIMTPKTRKLSSQAPNYCYRLLAEWMTGEQVENFETEYMVRGVELEDQAMLAYETLKDIETQPGGFITTDDGLIGCSPDRLVGDVGDLELKCPLIHTQVKYALEGTVDDDYMCQLQGRMMIHGREWVDIFAYHPRLVIPPVRVVRDDKMIADLKARLGEFLDMMLVHRSTLESRYGPFTRPAPEEPYSGDDLITVEDEEMIVVDLRRRNATSQNNG